MQTRHPFLLRWLRATSVFLCFLPCAVCSQVAASDDAGSMRRILERLDRLEQQNRELADQVAALRNELAASHASAPGELPAAEAGKSRPPDLAERMDVDEHRVEEMAQTKVESSQHFPIRITGMALFNSSINTHAGFAGVPLLVQPGSPLTGGATLRQSVIGLDYQGPEIFAGGKVHGFLSMDFYGATIDPYGTAFRIRTGGIEFNWADTSVMVGQDKPLISPREPNSLASVWIAPLSDSGNLWVWQPQVRFEQRLHLDDRTTLRAQASLFETREQYGEAAPAYGGIQAARPSLQARVAVAHRFDDTRRIEIGSGFAASTTHVAGQTVPSRAYTVDWFVNPWRKLEFSGSFFRGQDVTGLGGAGMGYTVVGSYNVIPVHADGGWVQFSIPATPRLTFNLFGGEQQNRGIDLGMGDVAKNQTFGGNVMYRIAPNVILSLESEQQHTNFFGASHPLNNHYDLGVAYLF